MPAANYSVLLDGDVRDAAGKEGSFWLGLALNVSF